MLVDTHVHPITRDDDAYPRDPRTRGRGPDGTNTVGEMARHARAADLDKVVLVQFVTVYGYDNSYCADCVAANPELYIGVCSVDPFDKDSPAQLSYWVTERGMRGLRLFTPAGWVNAPNWPDEETVHPIMARAEDLGIPVSVQARSSHLGSVKALATRYSVPLIVDHLAGVGTAGIPTPEDEDALLALAALLNVYLKFSTQNLGPPDGDGSAGDILRKLTQSFGAHRIMWGSNYPVSRDQEHPYEGLLHQARTVLNETTTEEERLLLLGGTAAAVYGG